MGDIPYFLVSKLSNGSSVVLGVADLTDVVDRFEIPMRKASDKSGYQRNPSIRRVAKLAREISSGNIAYLPPVLFSLRRKVNIDPKSPEGFLKLRNGDSLFVVDGQHRMLALKNLYLEDDALWGEYRLPFICLLGGSEAEEAKLFLEINQNAKKVDLNLAVALLASTSEVDASPSTPQTFLIVSGQQLVEDLESYCPVWRGRIQMAGGSNPKGAIGNGALGDSFRFWLNRAFVQELSRKQRALIVSSYWTAISQVLPGCFENPFDYGLQNQTGVRVLHRLLSELHEILISKHLDPTVPGNFVKYLKAPLRNFRYTLPNGVELQGEAFWRKGAHGGAGKFTSGSGQADLTSRLSELII
jgi:DGQHR domain-containing protein